MSENRTDRELQSRETEKAVPKWKRPELLPEPNPVEGWKFRWIRVTTMGDTDSMNVSAKIREGWTPCKAKDHPEIVIAAIESERFADNIVIGGLMLCKAPVEMVEERNSYYEQQAAAQMESVDNNFMREDDPRMRKFSERESKVSFGRGK